MQKIIKKAQDSADKNVFDAQNHVKNIELAIKQLQEALISARQALADANARKNRIDAMVEELTESN